MTESSAWTIGGDIAINKDGKVMLSDKCPCGALIWDISVTAGQTYSFNINYPESSIEDPAIAHILWGDEESDGEAEKVEYVTTVGEAYPVYHTYSGSGEYRIKVTGQVAYFGHSETYREFPIRAVTFDLSSLLGSLTTSPDVDLHGFYFCVNITEIL